MGEQAAGRDDRLGTRESVKDFENPSELCDIHVVQDGLLLGSPPLFEVISSTHVSAEYAGSRTIRHEQAFCLLFDVHDHLQVDRVGMHLVLGPNEVLLLAPGPSALFTLSHEKGTEYFQFQFRRPRGSASTGQRTLDVPEHVVLGSPGRMTHLMGMFMEESEKAGRSMTMLHHLVVLMLCEMSHSSQLPPGTRHHEDGLEIIASRVDACIAAHYREPIGTPDIAAQLRYNADYLERAYRRERSMSIREAINARRLREARAQLLLQRAAAIAKVASQCGYSDAASFRRVFKRATSMTPHRYRLLNAPPRDPSWAGHLRP